MFTFGKVTYIADTVLNKRHNLLKQMNIRNSIEFSQYIYDFYRFLCKNKFVKDNKMICPVDTSIYIGWFNDYKAIYIDNYNCTDYHFVIILLSDERGSNKDYICFRYYNNLADEDVKYINLKEYKDILQNLEFLSNYSDCVEGNENILRPNLEYLKSNIDDILNEKKYHLFSPILQMPFMEKFLVNDKDTSSIGWFYSILKNIDYEMNKYD